MWETVIGLEVHAQLTTRSKLFSGAENAYGATPNTQASLIDAGFPGVLPVLNQKAVQLAVRFGLAINAEINDFSFFERKNYFYPDLPKGYQISQLQRPIVGAGELNITVNNTVKTVTIARAHLEEDAGKSLHERDATHTGIDLNRAGTPLLEIVTTPCLGSAEEAVLYLKTLHQLLLFLNVCDGNMQEGSFRCDVNLSLRRQGDSELGVRTELKNLNSFRFIEKAIHYEEERHRYELEHGGSITQETRWYCPDTEQTHLLRHKEAENDYRYFPDPDLLPILITKDMRQHIKTHMPKTPEEWRNTLKDDLNRDDIDFLLTTPAHVLFYNDIKAESQAPAQTIVNWLKGPYTALLNEQNQTFAHPPIPAKDVALLLNHVANNTLSNHTAKHIFIELPTAQSTVEELVQRAQEAQNSTTDALDSIIKDVINNHPEQVADYRAGKDKLLAFFVGQVMKRLSGRGDPSHINALLRKRLT